MKTILKTRKSGKGPWLGSDHWCLFENGSCRCYIEDLQPLDGTLLHLQMMNIISEGVVSTIFGVGNLIGALTTGTSFVKPCHVAIEIRCRCQCSSKECYITIDVDGDGGFLRVGRFTTNRDVQDKIHLNENPKLISELSVFADNYHYGILFKHCHVYTENAWKIVKKYDR